MGNRTLSAQVNEDSELWKDFDTFQAGYESKSEAVRAAVRLGIRSDRAASAHERAADKFAGLTWDAAIATIALGFSAVLLSGFAPAAAEITAKIIAPIFSVAVVSLIITVALSLMGGPSIRDVLMFRSARVNSPPSRSGD